MKMSMASDQEPHVAVKFFHIFFGNDGNYENIQEQKSQGTQMEGIASRNGYGWKTDGVPRIFGWP